MDIDKLRELREIYTKLLEQETLDLYEGDTKDILQDLVVDEIIRLEG